MSNLAKLLVRLLVTGLTVLLAAIVGWQLWVYYMEDPWTRDGRVRADVIALAPDVSGWVTEVRVADNQPVRRGDVLFVIDRQRYELALQQAQATVANRQATMDQAQRDADRYERLDTTAVSQALREQSSSRYQEAKAAHQQALADLATAELNLARTVVIAPVNGIVTNSSLRPGAYVTAGTGVFALIDSDSFYVDGYFEETKLGRIAVGDPVTMHLMGERSPLHGTVQSIAGGIVDRERTATTSLLANVNPTFSWVRLAQRVPVRIKLGEIPEGVKLIAGRTVTVTVNEGGKVKP